MKLYKFAYLFRVPTRPGKPGKMRVHLENLEISWNFVKFNKYHGKMTCNLENLRATKILSGLPDLEALAYNL